MEEAPSCPAPCREGDGIKLSPKAAPHGVPIAGALWPLGGSGRGAGHLKSSPQPEETERCLCTAMDPLAHRGTKRQPWSFGWGFISFTGVSSARCSPREALGVEAEGPVHPPAPPGCIEVMLPRMPSPRYLHHPEPSSSSNHGHQITPYGAG